MLSARPQFNTLVLDNINAALDIKKVPDTEPAQKEEEQAWWPYSGVYGWPTPVSMDTSSHSQVFVHETPDSSLTAAVQLGSHLLLGEEITEDEFLFHRVSYRNPEMVETYLACYPEINDFLAAAWPVLVRCFGGPVDIVLEVMTYPDEAAYRELVGWIQSTEDIRTALDKLERFEDEWFLDHITLIGGRFNFNIETR
jgi:hypothetical protein